MNKTIKIKYVEGYKNEWKLNKIEKGDWIDLYVSDIESGAEVTNCDVYKYKKGDVIVINYGVAMELPEGYEAIIAPRSSTFQKYGLILTNSPSVIDNSYKGNDDIWKGKFIAMKDGELEKGFRLTHFRIQKNQPKINFVEVSSLDEVNRGGYGTSGK